MNHNAIVSTPTMPFRPLKRLVFIRPEVEEQTGLIVLARMSRQMPDRGVVLAMSQESQKELPDVKPGDRVLFQKQQQFLADDQGCTIIDCDYVVARL